MKKNNFNIYRKKGVGTTISSIIIVLVLFFFLAVFLAMSANHSQKKLQLNLDEAELLKMKNTYNLFLQSLGNTWRISAAQAIFKSGEESLGCGLYDYVDGNNIDKSKASFMDAGYWYQYKMNGAENYPGGPKKDILTVDERLPQTGENYTTRDQNVVSWPHICYPTNEEALKYINSKFESYKQIETNPEANGLTFHIRNLQSTITQSNNGLVSTVSQEISSSSAKDRIKLANSPLFTNDYETKFLDMVERGRQIVVYTMGLSDVMHSDTERRSNPLLYISNKGPLPDTKTSYLNKVNSFLTGYYSGLIKQDSGLAANIKVEPEILMGRSGQVGFDSTKDYQGLILHFKSSVTMADDPGSGTGTGTTCEEPKFTDIIQSKVDAKEKYQWNTGRYPFFNEQIYSLIEGMIQIESNWDPNIPSPAGAIGLMQIIPRWHPECLGDPDNPRNLRDPDVNIECGTNFIYDMMKRFDNYAASDVDAVKLALAAYNWGPDYLQNCLNSAGVTTTSPTSWEELVASSKCNIPSETINHVDKVMACADYYDSGGYVKLDSYSWPTDSRLISSCFGARWGKQHNGIDIARDTSVTNGNKVIAATGGTVEEVKKDCIEGVIGCGGDLGNYIFIRTEFDSLLLKYGHLKKGSIPDYIEKDYVVSENDVIAEIGNTGYSTGAHLHFAIYDSGGNAKNPCSYITCGDSTKYKCNSYLDLADIPGFNYYHDEKNNDFKKRPFSLKMKTEDYIRALDCVADLYKDPTNPSNNEYIKFYSWNSQNDLVCCAGMIWGCNLDGSSTALAGFADHNIQAGDIIEDEYCKKIVADWHNIQNTEDPSEKWAIRCTGAGFSEEEI